MTIPHTNADILKNKRGIIVHGCNIRGVFGAGLALSIKNKYPQAFKDYYNKVISTRIMDYLLGDIVVTQVDEELYIVSGFTQKFYGRDPYTVYVNYEALRQVFVKVNEFAQLKRLPVCFPLIGCGLANGEWLRVQDIIESTLSPEIERQLFTL